MLARSIAWLRKMQVRNERVVDETTMGNIRRLRWLVPVFLALDLLLLLVFAFEPETGAAQRVDWLHGVRMVYAVTAVCLVPPLVAAWRFSARSRPDPAIRFLEFLAPLGFAFFTVALTVIDQSVTSNITPYVLGSLSVSLLFLLPPTVALVLFALMYGAFFIGLGLTQADPILLLTNRANGFGATLLALVFSIVLWHKNAQYVLLQRELQQRNDTLETQQAELLWLATRDTLTGLYNRGEFLRLAELELLRAQRYGGSTSAIVVDLDFFKKINDLYGHPAGDAVLKHVGECMRAAVRGTDVVARIGGEEFMVLLPQTDIQAAHRLAMKLQLALETTPALVSSDLRVKVTASFGVGCMPDGCSGTVAALYAAADHALYEAKRKGRNRVERTEPDASLTPSDFQRMRRQ
jgi:diguanylate cyclase (GGDEF)-like protein